MNGLMKGPVSVAIDIRNMSAYKSGIFSSCGNITSHGSMVVGATDSYWLLKEAWTPKFGENGFMRLAPGNTCGVCQTVSFPTAV